MLVCDIVKGVFLLLNDRWGLAPVNAKSTSTPKARARRTAPWLRHLGAKSRRQAGAGRLDSFGLRLQRLLRLAPDRAGYADRTDRPPGKIRRRNRDATHFEIELPLVVGDPGAPDLRELAQQG